MNKLEPLTYDDIQKIIRPGIVVEKLLSHIRWKYEGDKWREPDPNAPRPASLMWCSVCTKPSKFQSILVEPPSKRLLPGFVANHMKCNGCGSVLATIYAEDEPDA